MTAQATKDQAGLFNVQVQADQTSGGRGKMRVGQAMTGAFIKNRHNPDLFQNQHLTFPILAVRNEKQVDVISGGQPESVGCGRLQFQCNQSSSKGGIRIAQSSGSIVQAIGGNKFPFRQKTRCPPPNGQFLVFQVTGSV